MLHTSLLLSAHVGWRPARRAVDPDFDVYWLFQDAEEELEERAESVLHDDLVGYVHTPILALGAGWRF